MALNVYEGLFLFDSNRYSRDPGGVSAQVADFVQKLGGEMLVSRLWEERRLAYPVNGQRKGTYWLAYFRMDGKQLTTLERDCQLSESIMRSLVIRIDPRIVDALVSHATAVSGEKARKPEEKEEKDKDVVSEVVEEVVPEMEEVGDVS
ncbi:MAG: 30S ribosomal protein S6 [Planctomycetia bacterium 21-64-5]|nr:MAG: 30S ribosomal protein S6 [Planctomycetia bacterium 21-64-5]